MKPKCLTQPARYVLFLAPAATIACCVEFRGSRSPHTPTHAMATTPAVTILVSGASGKLGALVVASLLKKRGAGVRVIAGSRDVSKLSGAIAQGAEARVVDFDKPDELAVSFAGVDRLVLVSTDAFGRRVEQQLAAIAAAKRAGVKHILYTSLTRADTSAMTVIANDHVATEAALKASGVAFTILRNNWYHENLLMSLPQSLARGAWATSAGEGRVAYTARADQAAAAARAALDAPKYAGRTLELSGPERLTAEEVAALATKVLGKPLAVAAVTDDVLKGILAGAGVPEFFAGVLVAMDAGIRAGALDLASGDLEELLDGAAPQRLEDYLRANAAAYTSAPAAAAH